MSLSIPLAGNGSAFVRRSSVSEEAGNVYAAWAQLGRPRAPKPAQLDALRELAEPARGHASRPIEAGRVTVDLTLSRHEVTLVEISAVRDETPPWLDDGRLLGGGT